MLYIPFLNLPTPHYSTTCPFTGVHTSTLVADVRSVSQVDSALLGIDSPSCWDKKNDANDFATNVRYTPELKKKTDKKWYTLEFINIWATQNWGLEDDFPFFYVTVIFWVRNVRFSGCTFVWKAKGSKWWLHPRTGTHPVCNLKQEHLENCNSKKQRDRCCKDACNDPLDRKHIRIPNYL